MKICTLCSREAKGFGWHDPVYYAYSLRGKATAKSFCSMECLEIFMKHLKTKEGTMIDPTNIEILALQSTLQPLGEYIAEVGIHKPFSIYTRQEVLTLVEVVVTAYQEFMQNEEEYSNNRNGDSNMNDSNTNDSDIPL